MVNRLLALSRGCVYAAAFLLPLFVLPLSLDPLELAKQTLLVALSTVAALSWISAALLSRRLSMRGGWLNILPLLVLTTTTLSAFLSKGSYLSWIGASTEQNASVVTMFAATVLFFVVVNAMGTDREHWRLHLCLIASAFLVAVVALLGVFGVTFLPSGGGAALTNTIGTVYAASVYLAVLAVYGAALWIADRAENRVLPEGRLALPARALILLQLAASLIVLLAVDYAAAWIVLGVGSLLAIAVAAARAREYAGFGRFVPAFLLLVVAVAFLFWLNRPFDSRVNEVEVAPSISAGWTVAKATLHDSPLFGTGPGTYLYDYARFRPTGDINQTRFWEARFDRASSFALTTLPTLGLLASAAWVLFLLGFALRGAKSLAFADDPREWGGILADFCGFLAISVALFAYPGNMTLITLLFLITAMLASRILPHARVADLSHSPRLTLSASIAAVAFGLVFVTVAFVTGLRYSAEMALASAVRADRGQGDLAKTIVELDRATRNNRFDDAASRTLSQALVLRVGQELERLRVAGEADADRNEFIQQLTAASVNAAKRATDLAPNNPINWIVRGGVYREFVPLINNAGAFAVEAFEKANELEPSQPRTLTDLGRTYLALAEAARPLTAAKDPEVAKKAKDEIDRNLSLAESAFSRAIEAKSDYAPAHFQLGLTYERQGRVNDAIGKMESVAKYNQLDVGVAFELGMLYLRRGGEGDLDRAQAALEHAVVLSPSYADARWFLASIYERKGDLKGAIEQVEKVAALNPDQQIIQARLKRLKAGQVTAELPEPVTP